MARLQSTTQRSSFNNQTNEFLRIYDKRSSLLTTADTVTGTNFLMLCSLHMVGGRCVLIHKIQGVSEIFYRNNNGQHSGKDCQYIRIGKSSVLQKFLVSREVISKTVELECEFVFILERRRTLHEGR